MFYIPLCACRQTTGIYYSAFTMSLMGLRKAYYSADGFRLRSISLQVMTALKCRSFCFCTSLSPRRKIRLIERNAKCRYLKKLTCKGTLRQLIYLSEAPSPPTTPYSPPPLLHTVYVFAVRKYLRSEYTE
jgi:hypothetical protein